MNKFPDPPRKNLISGAIEDRLIALDRINVEMIQLKKVEGGLKEKLYADISPRWRKIIEKNRVVETILTHSFVRIKVYLESKDGFTTIEDATRMVAKLKEQWSDALEVDYEKHNSRDSIDLIIRRIRS